MIISFINEDGGAGKTTIPSSLAPILADKGLRILIIDATPKASITRLFTENKEFPAEQTLYSAIMHNEDLMSVNTDTKYENVDLIPGHPQLVELNDVLMQMMLREKVQALKDNYDYIFIDTANNGNLVEMAITASDEVIIVLKPSRDSFYGADRSAKLVDEINERHKLSIKIKEVILNQYTETSTTYKVEGELRNHPQFQHLWKPEHNIYDSATINRLQYMYNNAGLEMGHVRASKAIVKLADDSFLYKI